MRKLLFLLLLIPSLASAQSVRYQNIALSSRGVPLANQNVAICTQPASTGTQPCSPLATLGTSTSTVSGGTNPTTTDANGNFFFYAPPGTYTIQIYGPQVSAPFVMPDVSISSAGVAVSVSSGGNVQNAINALPVGTPGGGTVVISPGSYVCPTSLPKGVTLMNLYGWGVPVAPPQIWSKFNGTPFNSFSSGTGSQNMVQFTGCTLNLTDVSQVGILGIVLDYGGTANMTIKGVSWSQFAMAVVNVPTTLPAVSYIGDVTNNFNSSNNKFYYIVTEGGNIGVSVGAATGNVASATEFDWVLNLVDTQPTGAYTGIAWVGQCDSNRVHRHSVFTTNVITNFKGEVFNTGNPTTDDDADSIIVDWYEETMNGAPAASTSMTVNQSKANIFTTGVTQSLTQLTVLQPTTTTYTWHESGQLLGTPNVEQAHIFQGDAWQGNPFTFANLGFAPISNGQMRFCSDCTIANPCAGGGTGAIAKRLNGVWVCN